MKTKKEIELWDIKDMYEYALKIYQIPENSSKDDYYKDSANQKIKRTLKEHHFSLIKEGDGREKYQISADIAKYIVEDFLYDYFMRTSPKVEEKRAIREKEHRQRVLEEIEKKSLEKDKELNQLTNTSEIANQLYDEIMTNPNYDSNGKVREKLESSKWKAENFHKLSNNSDVLKKEFEYHIPDYSVEELDNETVDKIIDRMMIRAIFDLFYEFDEKDFRMALYERAAHIEEVNESGVKPVSGYSELSRRLENPLDFYIHKKN